MQEKPASAEAEILDNRHGASLAGYLCQQLPQAVELRLVSAYFSIYGYEALADALDAAPLQKIKFLFGDPASAGEVASGEKAQMSFNLHEDGLTLAVDKVFQQRQLAERCAKWIEDKVEVRTMSKKNFLHGKMYHMQFAGDGGAAALGSSNFTKHGMGLAKNSNIELNIPVKSAATHLALAEWFDEIWKDKQLTYDVKEELLAALARWHEEYPPEFLYYKTLYELFRDDLEAQDVNDERLLGSHLYDTEIWQKLYDFQKDGAKSVISRLLRHGGCILADSVGLGKTYTALAVIKFFELRSERVLVLCPKKLENNWRVYRAAAAAASNPLANDRFSYLQLAHTDLSRETGMSGDVDLANFNWDGFDLVVIDESHNFRNQAKTRTNPDTGETESYGRYDKLLKDIISKGVKTKVLMLSATPVNTSLLDFRNQVYLMTEGQDEAFTETLQVKNIKNVVKSAQERFEDWEKSGSNNKNELLKELGGDFLRLLSGVVVARSRKQVKKFYGDYIKEYGDFPKREKPDNQSPHTDIKQSFSYEQVHGLISKIAFNIYRPSEYITDSDVSQRLQDEKKKIGFNQETREKFLIAMMHINFLKRFESSAQALKLTAERTRQKISTQIERIDNYLQTKQNAEALVSDIDYEDEEDEDFIVSRKAKHPYHLRQLDVEKWRENMLEDITALDEVLKLAESVSPDRDGKLQEIKACIRQKMKQKNKKLLIFTTFKDTASYLYEHIAPLAKELGVNAALVAGDETKTQYGRNIFHDILDNFSPQARRAGSTVGEQIDIVVATDCISEGQNLQDCDTVLNYDIHWNPVRVIQRFGRIDRIGSKNSSVRMINFWPHPDHEKYLKLRQRVQARMFLVDAAATGDDNTFDEQEEIDRAIKEKVKGQLDFHDELVRKMRDEIPDIEDLPQVVSMGDFTLDYFLMRLLRYLQEHKAALENAPPGIYAVSDATQIKLPADAKLDKGAIFFFRQKNTADKTSDNPTHPFYLVHVVEDGVRRYYTQANEILYLFEQLALPHAEPILKLCDAFAKRITTKEGRDFYGKMAQAAVNSIKQTSDDKIHASLKDKEAKLPSASKHPQADNLELITWLVIDKHE